jgi:hypothetical protein
VTAVRSYVVFAVLLLVTVTTGPSVLVPGALVAGPLVLLGGLLFVL